ncbi:MAG: flagellar export protein FliJ [Hyphomicrobiaceae bacterium]|nr:flagellar export protein FliJ [Hyphomicrobiaceae bacterium]
MKSPETATRAMRFEADEKTRKVQDLEQMIHEFEQVAADLQRQIQVEEERTGIRDAAHFAYSTFARSAAQRRDNLLASAARLKPSLDDAVRERDEYLEQMNRVVTVEQRPNGGGRARGRTAGTPSPQHR